MVFGSLKENMISMNKTILGILITISIGSYAQSNDSIKCLEKTSLYYSSYELKNYEDALAPWSWVLNNCPELSERLFIRGPKILKAKIKKDKENREAYIDTLMLMFDRRAQYHGKEGMVLGLKGYELIGLDVKYSLGRGEEALDYLQQSLDITGNQATVQAVYGYMRAVVHLEKSAKKSKSDVLEAYAVISDIVSYNIENSSSTKAKNNFIKISGNIEDLFTPYANCDDLINLFSKKFDSNGDDVAFLRRVTQLLKDKQCVASDLFFAASNRLYELDPSASSANQMANMSISRKKFSNAISFAKQAIEAEEDASKKAEYYLTLAEAYRHQGSYSAARSSVYSALKFKSGWGEAYMILGNIYVAGAKSCGDGFENKTVYWVAVDAFRNALSDPATNSKASRSINAYSKYFPKKESCFFNGIDPGSQYTVACWINQSTVVRTSD